MRVFMLLSWFDERPDWLAEAIASCEGLVDHVIALDGAYSTFPGGEPQSRPEQGAAIRYAAEQADIGLTLIAPRCLWASEIEKRSFLFRRALARAHTEDWLLVMDADMLVSEAGDTRNLLRTTQCDVADVSLYINDSRDNFRALYRPLPGLTVKWTHWLYVVPTDDGWRFLWHNTDGFLSAEPALDLRNELRIIHRSRERDPERLERADRYYVQRDMAQLEQAPPRGTL